MTKICNFPISNNKRCKQPVADDKPNCGRHRHNLSADQLGQSPTAYRKGGALHVWAGEPDGLYCLIHSDPAYQVLCQLAGEIPPCCLREGIEWKDENNWLHRDDGPALIKVDGAQHWYQHGTRHRDDGPAVIEADGTQEWWQHGEYHRDDGPAWIWPDGTQVWYQHGKRHRDGGPAMIEPDGTQWWYQHNKVHREDGPAVINASGTLEWWCHGEVHKEDGPAVIVTDGTQRWYWHDKQVTEEEHERLRGQSLGI